MSPAQKVERVAAVKDEFGLNRSLEVIGLAKSTWYYRRKQQVAYEEKYAHLRAELEEIARRWPEYGYRRTTTALREKGHVVNQKVVRRLHKSWGLALMRRTRRPKPSRLRRIIRQAGKRANLIVDLETIEPFEVMYTDFTELKYANGKAKAYFMPILDHASRLCLGWALGESPNRTVALEAWERAQSRVKAWRVELSDSILHQDQDSVYTSYAWTGRFLLEEKMRLSYALSGAKDNPHMESFFSRLKDEAHSEILEADTIMELQEVMTRRIMFYNTERLHSSLGNQAPLVFIRQMHPQWLHLHI